MEFVRAATKTEAVLVAEVVVGVGRVERRPALVCGDSSLGAHIVIGRVPDTPVAGVRRLGRRAVQNRNEPDTDVTTLGA